MADALAMEGGGGETGFFFRFLPADVAETGAETGTDTEVYLSVLLEGVVVVAVLVVIEALVVAVLVVALADTDKKANRDLRALQAGSDSARAALRCKISA